MEEVALPSDELTPDQQAQWQADLTALRSLHHDQDASPLLLGDLYLELNRRWGHRTPVLARLAGFHPFTLRRRARVAESIPPGHPLRASGLPYAILRLLAPIPQPQRWVQRALDLQAAGELRVRSFYQMLLDAGARGRHRTRPLRPPRCLRCHHELPEGVPPFHWARDGEAGYLCDWECAQAYLEAQEQHIAFRAERAGLPSAPPDLPDEDCESQDPRSAAAYLHDHQSPPPADPRPLTLTSPPAPPIRPIRPIRPTPPSERRGPVSFNRPRQTNTLHPPPQTPSLKTPVAPTFQSATNVAPTFQSATSAPPTFQSATNRTSTIQFLTPPSRPIVTRVTLSLKTSSPAAPPTARAKTPSLNTPPPTP